MNEDSLEPEAIDCDSPEPEPIDYGRMEAEAIDYIDQVGLLRVSLMELLADTCCRTNYEPLEMLYTRLGCYWLQNKASFHFQDSSPEASALARSLKYEVKKLDNHWGSIPIDGGRVNIGSSDLDDLLDQLSTLNDLIAYGMDPQLSSSDPCACEIEQELCKLQVGIHDLVREAEDAVYTMRDQLIRAFMRFPGDVRPQVLSGADIRWPGQS